MPQYEFRCDACSHQFTRFMSLAEKEKAQPLCPECGSEKVHQIFTSVFTKTDKKTW